MTKRYNQILKRVYKYGDLYLLILPVIVYFVLFKYGPMYGVLIAFKNYKFNLGVWNSEWVGLEHFARFFSSYGFKNILFNTFYIGILQLVMGFPVPIILALILNEMGDRRFKKVLQTVSYAPHFLSTVVLVSVLMAFVNPSSGIINKMLESVGSNSIYFMAKPEWFRPLYILSGIWQSSGWNSIIYMATLAGIDLALYEAASIDGANRFQRLIYVTLPSMIPVIITMLILDCGKILNVGFEKIFLMQNNLNIDKSEVISTYVYSMGIAGGQFSYSTAIGLFNSVINLIMLLTVNKLSKELTETSLW